jgi:hypothetical protein
VGGEFDVPAALAKGKESLSPGFAKKCPGLLELEINILFLSGVKLRFLGPSYNLYCSPLRTTTYRFSNFIM